jgi:putative ABC transport system permease protein
VNRAYFETLGVPLVEGRTFSTVDHLDSPPVVVVSATMARQFWPQGGAVGARIVVGPNPASTPFEVIGIVRDVRTSLVEAQSQPLMYMSLEQGWFGTTFIVRTVGDPLDYAAAMRPVVSAYDPALPITRLARLEDAIGEGLAARRLPMMLMLGFGALALLLAGIGIYALFSNMAVAREREFGVRMALGSRRSDVAALVLRDGARWMALGLAAGALGVYAVSRALSSLIFGIAPLDAVSIAVAVLALLVTATVALVVPVRRATRADPLSVMR